MSTTSGSRGSDECDGNFGVHAEDGQSDVCRALRCHLPRLVLEELDVERELPYVMKKTGVVFILDVSGYTVLGEELVTKCQGPDTIAELINGYFAVFVSAILHEGGDVIKFAVKIGLSVGIINIFFVGTEGRRDYVTISAAVEEAHNAEAKCEPGDIILALSAWAYCKEKDFSWDAIDDGFVKVRNVKDIELLHHTAEQHIKPVNTELEETVLKSFVIATVKDQLHHGHELELLSEVSQMCIAFIHILLASGNTEEQGMADVLQQSFLVISRNHGLSGCLTKSLAFDKGCSFLVIFGLPGLKHGNEAEKALKASKLIQTELMEIEGINSVSIGVTTGFAFCGIMGDHFRHEYTVIGRKVNVAARLMVAYPGVITCDEETYYQNRQLHVSNFKLEYDMLKGMKHIAAVYEYTEQTSKEKLFSSSPVEEFDFPLLGRQSELDFFWNKVLEERFIVFQGGPGVGKSRMLDAIIQKIEFSNPLPGNVKIVSVALDAFDAKMPFHAARVTMERLIAICEQDCCLFDGKYCLSSSSLEEANSLVIKAFCTIEDDHVTHAIRLCVEAFKLCVQFYRDHVSQKEDQYIMLVIDDAHYLDTCSIELLRALRLLPHCLCVMATWLCDKINIDAVILKLNPLDKTDDKLMAALAGQILDADVIPRQIVSFLQQNGNGIPGLCERLLHQQVEGRCIQFVETDADINHASTDDKDIIIDQELLVHQRLTEELPASQIRRYRHCFLASALPHHPPRKFSAIQTLQDHHLIECAGTSNHDPVISQSGRHRGVHLFHHHVTLFDFKLWNAVCFCGINDPCQRFKFTSPFIADYIFQEIPRSRCKSIQQKLMSFHVVGSSHCQEG